MTEPSKPKTGESQPAQKTSSANPSDSVTVRREIDRLARQTDGISQALKRLKDQI